MLETLDIGGMPIVDTGIFNFGTTDGDEFARYQFDPAAYIKDRLGWEPWGSNDVSQPGQIEVLNNYTLALRQLHERHDFENGIKTESELKYWQVGSPIQNRIRVEAGHGVGKTKLASGITSHFFDCFSPSIVYTFAPTWHQVQNLLWKEIRADRDGKDLRGKVLKGKPSITYTGDHFATGLATSDNNGLGTERAQGQHGRYLLFILDEAEGIADFVYSAIQSMASGGIAIVLMIGNPRTRTSRFYKQRMLSTVANFRMSCLSHPNVVQGREIIAGAVRRDYPVEMLDEHAEIVPEHNEDDHTFELPWQPGVIYKPDAEYMFRVLGIPPENATDDTLISSGVYDAARLRGVGVPVDMNGSFARIGVDVARFGSDAGTIYCRCGDQVWRYTSLHQEDYTTYAGRIIDLAKRLRANGVGDLHIRIDAGGGFGGGVQDMIKDNEEMLRLFPQLRICMVDFGGKPYDMKAYANKITELYANANDALRGLAILNPPARLDADLTDRMYKWVTPRQGIAVKQLEPKQKFKDRNGYSPDDGDGLVMAIGADHLFNIKIAKAGSRV